MAAIRLRWSAFPEAPLTPKGTSFEPERIIDLTTTYGRPDCSGYPTLPARRPAAEIHLAGADERVLTRPIDEHGQTWLRRLWTVECEAAALNDVASIRLLDTWTRIEVDGKPYLRGRLELERVGSREPVTVTSLFGSILLAFRPADPGQPVAVLAGDQQRLRIPVLVGSSNRCDDHGLSGATQTFLLSAYVSHGPTPVQRVILTLDAPTRDRAQRVAFDACKG